MKQTIKLLFLPLFILLAVVFVSSPIMAEESQETPTIEETESIEDVDTQPEVETEPIEQVEQPEEEKPIQEIPVEKEDQSAASDSEKNLPILHVAQQQQQQEPEEQQTRDFEMSKTWIFSGYNEQVFYMKNWIDYFGLTGTATFEFVFENLDSGTFKTVFNGQSGEDLVVKNGKAIYKMPLVWYFNLLDSTADSTFTNDTFQYSWIDWGTSFLTVKDIPIGTRFTVTEIDVETNYGKINWDVKSQKKDYTRQNEYGYYTYSIEGGNSMSVEIQDDTGKRYINTVAFTNTKKSNYNVTIKKEVSGIETDETFEVLIIPYQWNDTKRRYNVATITSVEKLQIIDPGREGWNELVDLSFFAKNAKYIFQLTLPAHEGENWEYATIESLFSQIEKKNDADAGYLIYYDYELAKQAQEIINRDTNYFFEGDAAHLVASAKKFNELIQAKGYKNYKDYFMNVIYEMDDMYFENDIDRFKALVDEIIKLHQEAGLTQGDYAFAHMMGHLGLINQWWYAGEELSGIELYEGFEYYDEIKKLLSTTTVIRHGDVIDVTEYLKYTNGSNMVLVFEKDYTGRGYKRAQVITNWVNPQDFTLEELLKGEGTIELTAVLENVYELPIEAEEELTEVKEESEEAVQPKEEKVAAVVLPEIHTGVESVVSLHSVLTTLSLAGMAFLKRKH